MMTRVPRLQPRLPRLGAILVACGGLLGGGPWACGEGATGRLDPTPNVELASETVASGFDTIWELAWGPDGAIWVTERPGTISRLNPQSGAVTRVGQRAVAEIGEGGLMGLAFHPDFATQPWVYVAHTYNTPQGTRNRIVRMRYDGSALGAPEVILADIPGSSIHNGSRLIVGPDRLLYVTTGDASIRGHGAGPEFPRRKILRLTSTDSRPGNPLGTRLFTFGHRNPQGITFAPDGSLYITEHGPSDNDDSRVETGRNYGWPNVRGRCDGDAGPGENTFCQANNVAEPLAARSPTIAPAGLAYYDGTLIPQWRGSLLFTTLKEAALHRLALSTDGRSIQASETLFEGTFGRLAPSSSHLMAASTSARPTRMAAVLRCRPTTVIRIRPS